MGSKMFDRDVPILRHYFHFWTKMLRKLNISLLAHRLQNHVTGIKEKNGKNPKPLHEVCYSSVKRRQSLYNFNPRPIEVRGGNLLTNLLGINIRMLQNVVNVRCGYLSLK